MGSGSNQLSRQELYDKHNMPTAGCIFVAHLLPILETMIKVESDIETDPHDEVLAEIALWKAFNNEPKTKPFLILSSFLLFYDYLYSLPLGVYGLSIVGLATLGGLMPSLRGRRLLAAEHAKETDEDGIPANLRLSAINVANSSVTLVFVAVGIAVQMMATSGLVGGELLKQNRMVGGPIPPIGTVLAIFFCLTLFSLYRFRTSRG